MRYRWLAVLAIFLAACTGSTDDATSTTDSGPTTVVQDLREDYQRAQDELQQAQDELQQAQDELQVLLEQVGVLTGQFDALSGEFEALKAEKQARESALKAETRAAQSLYVDAIAERDAILLQYDAQIRAAIAEGEATIAAMACEAVSGDQTDRQVEAVVDVATQSWANQAGFPDGVEGEVAKDGIVAAALACRDAEAEKLNEERLRAPRGDGFWTVGEEIAVGTWESQGTGDSCYWARLNANQDTLDNSFGNAGGRVTIRSSDTEVEFSGCGIWEYQG